MSLSRNSLVAMSLSIINACAPDIAQTQTDARAGTSSPSVTSDGTQWGNRLRPLYHAADDGSLVDMAWWFWANPAVDVLPEYAQNAYAPLRSVGAATPFSWRPLLDIQFNEICLFYETSDKTIRCLPGWSQVEADDPLDGFYAESTCTNFKKWLYVLPSSEVSGRFPQRHLVLAKASSGSTPRVYKAIRYGGRVWHRVFDGFTRTCVEVEIDVSPTLFFTPGAEVSLLEFVKLGDVVTDRGPA